MSDKPQTTQSYRVEHTGQFGTKNKKRKTSARCKTCGKPKGHVAHTKGLPPNLPMRQSREDKGVAAHKFVEDR